MRGLGGGGGSPVLPTVCTCTCTVCVCVLQFEEAARKVLQDKMASDEDGNPADVPEVQVRQESLHRGACN